MDETGQTQPPRRGRVRSVVALTGVLLAIALFLGLGVWQVERRAWKLDLIARVDARLAAAPVPAPGPPDWAGIGRDDEYTRVTATGHFLNDHETPVLAVTIHGSGSWILTPFVTPEFTVLVNRGFVPPDKRDPATREAPDGEVTVTGLLRLAEPGGGFLRSNDPAAGRWYSRDVAAITAQDGLGPAAPYFIDADATPNPGGLPIGGLTVVSFRNTHLIYALTWFGLAAGLAALAWRSRRF
ncbi:surfeit locus 1 family protein [Amaricoccus macauensis]|uniref:SURF1-like protein n=1 Tax=Amaricoccus macauensis TaxID=57001 RepID=A0A840SNX9_9RHOB|nr:SURF1 family protein [Amaricoccus macauensis]MBB5222714.1 surfeit locus 1 family protein [Amaricoccus macauensis]